MERRQYNFFNSGRYPFLATSSGSLIGLPEEDIKKAIEIKNYPNPFTQITNIKCHVPEGSQSASICVFDTQGVKKEQILITGFGNQTIKIDGYSLYPGLYLYSLIIDNKVIDTKRMILTE